MLSYSLRDLLRNPRRTLASVVGVALGVGLFASIAFFIDGSAASMSRRAIAPLPLDVQVMLSSPLASTLTLKETIEGPAALAAGQTGTITLTATNEGKGPANAVVIRDELPTPLTYMPGTTTLNGRRVPDDEERKSQVVTGLNVGTLAPKATATVTYVARAASPIESVRALALHGTVTSHENPVPTNANSPRAITLEELAPMVAGLRDVTAVDRLAYVDLPGGSMRSRGTAVSSPIRLYVFDPDYQKHYPSFSLTAGSFAPDAAVLSVEASKASGAAPGAIVELGIPGRAQPLALPVSGVADFSGSAQLFSSRVADTLGDFIYVPHVVVVPPALFESTVLPALRVDAGSPRPVLRNALVMEMDVRVDTSRLNADPAAALRRTKGLSRSIERIAPGQVSVIDNLSKALTVAKSDALVGKILFLFLGLPGVLLAAYLAGYAGSLLAQAQRREHATLRARGAQPRHLIRLLGYSSLWVAGLGSLLGLGLGLAAMIVIFGRDSLLTVARQDLLLSALLAVAAGLLATAIALYVPGRRAVTREVTEERRELEVARAPAWQRLRLDILLIVAALIVEGITYLSGGFRPKLAEASEGETISLSFYMLLAPLAAWFGAVFLGVRLFLAAAGRFPNPREDRFGAVISGTLRRSLKRRPQGMVAGVIAVGLAQAFGTSIVIFVATYHAEKAADARFVVGSDLRVIPSPLNPQPADFASRLQQVPGVAAATPVMFRLQNAVLGNEAKDLAAVDTAGLERTAYLSNSFFLDGSAAAAMAALRADPAAVLVDWETARDANIQTGDPVKLLLKDAAGGEVSASMRSVGRFKQFPGFPQHTDMVANLSYYQTVTGLKAINFFTVRAADPSPAGVARAAEAIRALPGLTNALRIETTATALNKDQSSLAALNLNSLGSLDLFYMALMSAAGIGIFVFGLLLQRRREYMTLRALGIRMRQLQGLLVGEAASVAVLALLIAVVVGTAMAYMFVQILRPVFTLPPDRLSFPPDQMVSLAALVLAAMAVSTLAAGALLRRLKPIELIREE